MKKIIAAMLVFSLLLTLGACTGGNVESTTNPAAPTSPTAPTPGEDLQSEATGGTTPPTVPEMPSESPVTDPLVPSTPVPTVAAVTEPTGTPAEPTIPENTGIGTDLPPEDPTQPDPDIPRPTNPTVTPTKPTEPAATQPQATQPNPTTPSVTEPSVTEPPATVPPATKPTPTTPKPVQCRHSYKLSGTRAASCTSAKVETYSCSKCGDSYQKSVGVPTDHFYEGTVCTQFGICRDCGATSSTTLGHNFNTRGICTRCGEEEPGPAEITVSIRDTSSNKLANITVTIYLGNSDTPAGTDITDSNGLAYFTLDHLETYRVVLTDLPDNVTANSSYTFTSKRANITLAVKPVLDPLDHSKAKYQVGSTMADFTLSDTDGNIYNLYELLKEKELVILDFWYCACAPCKSEFPYFDAALDLYSGKIELLALNPLDSLDSILALRQELGSTFAMLQDTVNLYRGFDVTAYPVTVFIDSNGKVLSVHRGAYTTQNDFLSDIAKHLK